MVPSNEPNPPKHAASQARKEEKRRRAEAAATETAKRPVADAPARLPDGAKFEVVYSAARMEWTGTLTIGAAVFAASASAVFKLLNRLDGQYRASVEDGERSKE